MKNSKEYILRIPEWYLLTSKEEEIIKTYIDIVESSADDALVYWSITLNCAACCQGCYFFGFTQKAGPISPDVM